MKRMLLGLLAVIVLFFAVLVVLDRWSPDPDDTQETPSTDSARPRDDAQQKAPASPSATSERTIKLALSLPRTDSSGPVHLLPTADQLVAGDAYVLYDKAHNALPVEVDEKVLSEWGRMKPELLPLDEVESLLGKAEESLALIDQAIFCTNCNWPAVAVNAQPSSLSPYRLLARFTGLKAAHAIADDDPQGAIQALRMGFGMARHAGQGPTLNHGMVGIAMAAFTSRQITAFAQQDNGISLYGALASLPSPLISLDEVIQAELGNLDKDPKVNFLNRKAFLEILEPAHERARFLAKRFDRDMKALLCLEAIRLYGAAHDGAFPETLSEIMSWSVPQDPVHGQPFVYVVSGATAILESPAPQDDPRSGLQYEISLKPR